MKFLDIFKRLFSKKKPEETEKRRQEIENSLQAKIKIEKEKYRKSTMKKLTVKDLNKQANEKEMRRLIQKKRKERETIEKGSK